MANGGEWVMTLPNQHECCHLWAGKGSFQLAITHVALGAATDRTASLNTQDVY